MFFNSTNLTKVSITNTATKKIAVLLPFKLHRIDLDSVSETKEIILFKKIILPIT